MKREQLSDKDLIEMYRLLVLTRRFEEKVNQLYQEGRFAETPHSSIGQEAVGVGATYGLRRTDYVLPSLRTRAAFIAKGVPLRVIMAAMYAKATSPSKGRHTSHHLGDVELRVPAGSGVVGSSIPVAVGVGLAEKLKGADNVSVVFFGDGASNRGDFHEAANLAAALTLPVVFVCENNLYAMSTRQSSHQRVQDIALRAAGYGMPGVTVDGQDVLAVYEAVQAAVARARAGQGPSLVECKTYRFRGHSEHHHPDDGRPADELAEWRAKCPVKKFEDYLKGEGLLDASIAQMVRDQADREIQEAIEYAEASPFPRVEEAFADVYAS